MIINHLSMHNDSSVNMIGLEDSDRGQNGKYVRRIDQHSVMDGTDFLNLECMALRSELEIIKQRLNQLKDIIIHQHHFIRELFTHSQIIIPVATTGKVEESMGYVKNSKASSLETVKLSRDEHGRLKGQEEWLKKIAKESIKFKNGKKER